MKHLKKFNERNIGFVQSQDTGSPIKSSSIGFNKNEIPGNLGNDEPLNQDNVDFEDESNACVENIKMAAQDLLDAIDSCIQNYQEADVEKLHDMKTHAEIINELAMNFEGGFEDEEVGGLGGYEAEGEERIEEKNWIKNAIKKPGSLRKIFHTKKGETIPTSKINKKLSTLKNKREKSGKLSSSDLKLNKKLNLAKTLKKMN